MPFRVHNRDRLLGVALWLFASLGWSGAQTAPPLTTADTTGALTGMAAQAGVIFAGHVVSMTRNEDAGYVDVNFAIDQPVSGCPATNSYIVREWLGLWAGNAARYQVGQRYLMMLHLPGAAGLSAPVGGLDGAIPLVSAGAGPVMDAAGQVTADAGPGALSGVVADLRWVQARAMRTAGTTVVTKPVGTGPQPRNALIVATAGLAGDGTQATLESVLAVLRGVSSGSR